MSQVEALYDATTDRVSFPLARHAVQLGRDHPPPIYEECKVGDDRDGGVRVGMDCLLPEEACPSLLDLDRSSGMSDAVFFHRQHLALCQNSTYWNATAANTCRPDEEHCRGNLPGKAEFVVEVWLESRPETNE